MPRHWLVKTEPACYSIDDLKRDRRSWWSGVRNYQARNFMRDDMAVGDQVLVHHSSADPPGVAGIAKVSTAARADPSAWAKGDEHFDSKASPENPIWCMVELAFVERFADVVAIAALRADPALRAMSLLRPGQRLSVMPVTVEEFERVVELGRLVRAAAPPASGAASSRTGAVARDPGSSRERSDRPSAAGRGTRVRRN